MWRSWKALVNLQRQLYAVATAVVTFILSQEIALTVHLHTPEHACSAIVRARDGGFPQKNHDQRPVPTTDHWRVVGRAPHAGQSIVPRTNTLFGPACPCDIQGSFTKVRRPSRQSRSDGCGVGEIETQMRRSAQPRAGSWSRGSDKGAGCLHGILSVCCGGHA